MSKMELKTIAKAVEMIDLILYIVSDDEVERLNCAREDLFFIIKNNGYRLDLDYTLIKL